MIMKCCKCSGKAKEMLEKLGYVCVMEDNNCIIWNFPNGGSLRFWKHSQTVSFDFYEPYNEFDLDELCAIAKQLKEMRGEECDKVSN